MRTVNPYNNYTMYRKIPDYGWIIVGRPAAARHHAKFYVGNSGVSCRRRHYAPIYVENNRCAKCVQLRHYEVPLGETLTIDIDPDQPVDIDRIAEFWRKKLGLPLYKKGRFHYVFIIDDVPYFSRQHLRESVLVIPQTIANRCKSTKHEFANYVSIKVPGNAGKFSYCINGTTYLTQRDAAKAMKVPQAVVSIRCNSPEWTTWSKVTR